MDQIDREILRELQRDGRLTNAALSERVGLSATPCLRRVRHLEETGVISRYLAKLDGSYLGRGFESFVAITMKQDDSGTMSKFETSLVSTPGIIEAHRLFGDPDYILRIAVSDITAYERFYTDVLAFLPGVQKIKSHLTMKVVRADEGFPVD